MSARVSSLCLDFFLSIRPSLSSSFRRPSPLPTYLPTNQPPSLPPDSLGFVRQGREVRRRLAAGSQPALRQIEAEEAAWAAAGYEAHLHLRPGGAPPPPQRRARNLADAMSCARARVYARMRTRGLGFRRCASHARTQVRIHTQASACTRKQARASTHAHWRGRSAALPAGCSWPCVWLPAESGLCACVFGVGCVWTGSCGRVGACVRVAAKGGEWFIDDVLHACMIQVPN